MFVASMVVDLASMCMRDKSYEEHEEEHRAW